jgi:hypothetical protein
MKTILHANKEQINFIYDKKYSAFIDKNNNEIVAKFIDENTELKSDTIKLYLDCNYDFSYIQDSFTIKRKNLFGKIVLKSDSMKTTISLVGIDYLDYIISPSKDAQKAIKKFEKLYINELK